MSEILSLPKSRMPNDLLLYCAVKAGGSIESYLDNDIKLKDVNLGHFTFTGETNREVLEKVFQFIHNLPKPGLVHENTVS